jgi:peptidyl-prolyl cis-trans isomerase A (cyclophilin A)
MEAWTMQAGPTQSQSTRRSSLHTASAAALLVLIACSLGGCPLTQTLLVPAVDVETTAGNFSVALNPQAAPQSSERFLQLVDNDYYDNTLVHQVITERWLQGGLFDPNFVPLDAAIPVDNESDPELRNTRGTIALVFTQNISDGRPAAQFLINIADNPEFDATPGTFGFPVFGVVIEGLDVLDAIGAVAVAPQNGFDSVPVDPIIITQMTTRIIDTGEIILTPEAQAFFDQLGFNAQVALRSFIVDVLGAAIQFGF